MIQRKITSNTDTHKPLAAFTMIDNGNNCGQDTFRGLVWIGALPTTTTQIKASGVEGFPFANDYLWVRECHPADLHNYSSLSAKMIALHNDLVKKQALLTTAHDCHLAIGRERVWGNNGCAIISYVETFSGAVMVTCREFEWTVYSFETKWRIVGRSLKGVPYWKI